MQQKTLAESIAYLNTFYEEVHTILRGDFTMQQYYRFVQTYDPIRSREDTPAHRVSEIVEDMYQEFVQLIVDDTVYFHATRPPLRAHIVRAADGVSIRAVVMEMRWNGHATQTLLDPDTVLFHEITKLVSCQPVEQLQR